MADLTSATTPSGHTVTVGQTYAHLDTRESGRHVKILAVNVRYAYIRSIPAPGTSPDTRSARTTRVQLAAFHPDCDRRSGYGLIQEAPPTRGGDRIEDACSKTITEVAVAFDHRDPHHRAIFRAAARDSAKGQADRANRHDAYQRGLAAHETYASYAAVCAAACGHTPERIHDGDWWRCTGCGLTAGLIDGSAVGYATRMLCLDGVVPREDIDAWRRRLYAVMDYQDPPEAQEDPHA